MNVELLGWAASLCFALSCLPFAWQAIRWGRAEAPLPAILLVLAGGSGMFTYEMLTAQQWPQLLDFGVSAVAWGVVLFVKLKGE